MCVYKAYIIIMSFNHFIKTSVDFRRLLGKGHLLKLYRNYSIVLLLFRSGPIDLNVKDIFKYLNKLCIFNSNLKNKGK